MSTAEVPAALVGVALDVSGSMQGSLQNRSGPTRYQSVQQALERVLDESRRRARQLAGEGLPGSEEVLFFAYAFGLTSPVECGDLFALMRAAEAELTPEAIEQAKQRQIASLSRQASGLGGLLGGLRSGSWGGIVAQVSDAVSAMSEAEIRRRVMEELFTGVQRRLREQPEVTQTLTQLAQWWSRQGSRSFSQAEQVIFAQTPMRQCLTQVADRFRRERAKLPDSVPAFFLLISDGEPTDGDPRPALKQIQQQGVFTAACLLTDRDMTDARRLYGQDQPHWTAAARLMFEAASVIDEQTGYREILESRGWQIDEQARLFAQINQSEYLSEFVELVFDRIRDKNRGS